MPPVLRLIGTKRATLPIRTKHGLRKNKPCPCGSGKKLKHCHAATPCPQPSNLDRARLIYLHGLPDNRRFGAKPFVPQVEQLA